MHQLDPTNPQPIDVAEETLNIRHSEFSSEESLLMSAFSLLATPPDLTVKLRCDKNAPLPLTRNKSYKSLSSVDYLAPIIFGAPSPSRQAGTIQVSCYALFKGWLLLSQPPCCIGNETAFTT
jgi:hypothetical protein